MKTICSLFILLFTSKLSAQVYIEGGKTRHRFAQLNIGIDFRTFSSQGTKTTIINSSGIIVEESLRNHTETRLLIGGTHFWGHADFQLGIPIVSFEDSDFHTGVETAMKLYPWQLEFGKIRPFIGLAWQPDYYQQRSGVKQINHSFPLVSGLTYLQGSHLLEINAGYNFNNSRDYFIGVDRSSKVKTPRISFSFAYKYMIETTLGAEKNHDNGRTKLLTDTLLKLGKLNGLTISIGSSSAIFLTKSTNNRNKTAFLGEHKISSAFIEYGLGYYFHKSDIHINALYRSINSELQAYGFTQKVDRKSFAVEAFKFLLDYNGFALFLGAAISQEWIKIHEKDSRGEIVSYMHNGKHPGMVVGWDIRPNRLQSIYLRTNLRWFPHLDVKMGNDKNFSMDQLEINFIQVVIFPSRIL